MYLPLIIVFIKIQERILPKIGGVSEILFSVGIPALMCIMPYLLVSIFKCPNCKRHFFKSNPFSPDFGADVECKHCRFGSSS
jgi:hypothetical protein